jgi:ankyrin repeat protein
LLLLKHGADPNVADSNGITALHYAVQKGLRILTGYIYDAYNRPAPPNMAQLVSALLAHGANPNARIKKTLPLIPFHTTAASMQAATPFFLAAVAADFPTMRVLADHGANPLLMNSQEVTPLMMAAGGGARESDRTDEEQKSAFEAVKLAVELGADVNAVSVQGETALHFAADTGNDASVQFLVDKGAKLDVRDKSGQTPWSLAMGIGIPGGDAFLARYHKSTSELLLKLGAHQWSYKDVNGTRYTAASDESKAEEGPDQ